MNNLPKDQNSIQTDNSQQPVNPSDIKPDRNVSTAPPKSVSATGAGSKEIEPQSIDVNAEKTPLKELGGEIKLDREVEKAGIKVRPTYVPVPQSVSASGVTPVGDNAVLGTGKGIKLPITDDQIKEGQKKNLFSSWRWLTEWCLRQIKIFQRKTPAAQSH